MDAKWTRLATTSCSGTARMTVMSGHGGCKKGIWCGRASKRLRVPGDTVGEARDGSGDGEETTVQRDEHDRNEMRKEAEGLILKETHRWGQI